MEIDQKQHPHFMDDALSSFQRKCGEIFLSDDSMNYLFVCTFCNENFMNLGFFIDHLQGNHMDIDKKVNYRELEEPIKIEIKTEHIESQPDVNLDPLEEFSESDESPLSVIAKKPKKKKATKSKKKTTPKAPPPPPPEPKPIVLPNQNDPDVIKPMTTRKAINAARKIKPFKCDECTRSYFNEEDLVKHKTSHSKRPFKCELCGLGWQCSTFLKIHMRRHNGEKPFKCDVTTCGKGFTTAYELKVHKRVHDDEKPFVCEICGKGFRVLATLTDHMKVHLNIRDHKCNQCEKAYRNSWLLLEHMKLEHAEKPVEHECEVCGKKFLRPKSLYHHRKIHSDVKKYVCKLCNKAYAQCAGLHAHMKSHNEIRDPDRRKRAPTATKVTAAAIGEGSQSMLTSSTTDLLQNPSIQYSLLQLQFGDNVHQ